MYIVCATCVSRYLTDFAALLSVPYSIVFAIQSVKTTGIGHKDCPHLLLHTPSTPVQQHQLTLTPQATLRLTGGVPGKVGLHQTTYVCSVFFFITLAIIVVQQYMIEVDTLVSMFKTKRCRISLIFFIFITFHGYSFIYHLVLLKVIIIS